MALNVKGKYKYILKIIKYYPEWWQIFYSRLSRIPSKTIRLNDGTVVVGGNKSLIVDLIDEIFIEQVYNPKFLSIKPGDIVVDIGANIGVFSLYAAKMGATQIYAIEPFPDNIPLIMNNFKVNTLKSPEVFEKAISGKNGTTRLYLGDLDSHGLLSDHNNTQTFKDYVLVKTTSLSKFLLDNKIEKVDFLKIDCEGSEGVIITSTPKTIWNRIEKIAIEYHNGVSTLNNQQIVDKLKAFGYKVECKPIDDYFGYIYAWR